MDQAFFKSPDCGAGEGNEIRKDKTGASLVVQWLRLCIPNAGGLGLIPVRACMPQLRPGAAK